MKTRPGGRTAKTTSAVFDAVKSLLAEQDPATITMGDISARAAVAASSLYRRWGDVRTLLTDVAVERLLHDIPLPDTGSLRGDLEAWAQSMATSLTSVEGSAFFRVLVGAAPRSPAEGASRLTILEPRIEQIGVMLERAGQRGVSAPTIMDVIDYLLAPLYVRTLLGVPIEPSTAVSLVDMLLIIAAARTRSTRV